MGQDVQIKARVTVGDVLILDTDRSFTGQDGAGVTPQSELVGFPGALAGSIFDLELDVDYVHVLQNTVTVRRAGGWDDAAIEMVADATTGFLRFYSEEA